MIIEKLKILSELFWSYQLNCTANSAHLAHFYCKWAGLAGLFAGSSKTALRILIFSNAMGADYSFQLNSLET